jgi:hypothetical protein
MDESIRWTVKVSKDTDVSLRMFLAQLIEEAVRWRVIEQTVAETKARNANVPLREIESAINEALAAVRAERFAPRG